MENNFDDYEFEGEVDDFYQWVHDGADYNIWHMEPLEKDILPSSDYVIDGKMGTESIVENIINIIN